MKPRVFRCENIMVRAGCVAFVIPTTTHRGLPGTFCVAAWLHSDFQRQSRRTKSNKSAVSELEEKHTSYGLTLTTERRRSTATLWNSINTYWLWRHLETVASILCCLAPQSKRYIRILVEKSKILSGLYCSIKMLIYLTTFSIQCFSLGVELKPLWKKKNIIGPHFSFTLSTLM